MDPLKFPNACDLFQIFYNDLTYTSFATSSDKLLLNLSEALTFCSHGELPFHSQISYFYIIFIYVNIIISSNAQPRLEQSLPTLGTHKTQLVVAEVCTVYIRKYRLLFKGPPPMMWTSGSTFSRGSREHWLNKTRLRGFLLYYVNIHPSSSSQRKIFNFTSFSIHINASR